MIIPCRQWCRRPGPGKGACERVRTPRTGARGVDGQFVAMAGGPDGTVVDPTLWIVQGSLASVEMEVETAIGGRRGHR